MLEVLKIPEDRLPVLIGRKGSVKSVIEEYTRTRIRISDVVRISGDDALGVLTAKNMVTAIGRGFSPEKAERLADDRCGIHVISLQGHSPKKRERLLGRVIGKHRRSLNIIEKETGASIVVRGKTVAIIGTPEEMGPAEEAVTELLGGSTHGYAFKTMDRKREQN